MSYLASRRRMACCISICLLSLLTLSTSSATAQVQTWVEETFEDFADGKLDASGQNIYVSRDGAIRTIHRFDLNQDGHIDLIFNSTHDSYAFIPASVASVTHDRRIQRSEVAVEGSECVVVADLNRDGYRDLVFSPNHSGIQHPRRFVTIVWGGPDGWPVHRTGGVLPICGATAIAVADLNHDEWLDIAVLGDDAWMVDQPTGKIVRIFWGSERGFVLMRRQDLGFPEAIDLASGDLDGDGAADLAVLAADSKIHLVWSMKSQAESLEFPRQQIMLPGKGAQCITIADANGDHGPDLIVGSNNKGAVYIVPGQSGRKWDEVTIRQGFDASHVVVGDLDADTFPDLVLTDFDVAHAAGGEVGAAGEVDTSVRILWGGHAGADTSQLTAFDIPYAVATAIGDLDGDGQQDLAVAVHQGAETYQGESVILFGRGNRQWKRADHTVRTEGASDVAIVPGATNQPSHVIFCNSQGGTLHEKVPPLLYWGSEEGFIPQRHWKVPVNSGYEASAADLNADGFVDLISINSGHVGELAESDPHLGASIFWGDSSAHATLRGFDETKRTVLREFSLGASNVADLNRDGYLDVVLGAYDHDDGNPEVLVIHYGAADGFDRSRRAAIECPHRSLGCAIGDYNRDTWLDIAVTCSEKGEVRVFWGSPDGFDATRKTALDVSRPIGLETADLNRDGYLDIIAGSYHDIVEGHHDTGTFIFWGTPQGFRQWNAQWLPGFTPIGLLVADFDADGFLDLFSPHYHAELTRESLPCYLYWGSESGFATRNRKILICDSAHDAMAADFDRDGRLDLAVSCHTRDGSHFTNSRIFYNDGQRFAKPRIVYLPTHGTHWMYVQDMGHIYHRKWEQTYVSSIFEWDRSLGHGELTSKADCPTGTQLLFEVKAGSNKKQLAQATWQAMPRDRFVLRRTDRCLQYRATFKSDNGDRYPVLDRVVVNLD